MGRFRQLWSGETGLTALLVFLLLYFILLYPLQDFVFGRVLARLSLTLTLVFGIVAVAGRPLVRIVVAILAAIVLILALVELVSPGRGLAVVLAIGYVLFLGVVMVTVIMRVFQPGRVTVHRISGALVVYLLFGGLCASLYVILALLDPGSFQLPAGLNANQPIELQRTLVYYSFTTLTTLGYGDILPIRPAARMVAILEAMVGMLYPAIILARLVSLELGSRRDDPGNTSK